LEDMIIGENLIITSDYTETVLEEITIEAKKVEDETFYHFNFKF